MKATLKTGVEFVYNSDTYYIPTGKELAFFMEQLQTVIRLFDTLEDAQLTCSDGFTFEGLYDVQEICQLTIDNKGDAEELYRLIIEAQR